MTDTTYQRVGSTTSAMPQARYEALLLERTHGHSRWENTPARGVTLKDLDREEILRTVRLGVEAGRLPESTGRNIGDILDRLRLRNEGQLLNAAVVLFGKESVFDFPQRQLRLAWFKGAGSVFVRFQPLAARTTATSGATSGAEWELVLATLGVDEMSPVEVATRMGKSSVTGSLKRILRHLMAEKLIAQTIPDKPRSRLQKYRLTEKGKAMVATLGTDQVQPPRSEPSQ